MTIDVARIIGATSRELTTREYEGRPARVLVATRVYDTTQDDLWDALTNPERIPRWFLPVEGDLRPGGTYQLTGNAGGHILRCDAPRHLALTWGMHGQVSWVNVDLSPEPSGGTRLRLEHIAHVPDDMWDQFGPGAVGVGWDQAMLGLDQHLSTGRTLDPRAGMAWVSSDEGRAFVRGGSDAWCEASIAAGTDPASARAAAERTRAFYTGEAASSTAQ
jgi:uncharacterized protein YndB with AHSA1/START domain